MITEVPIAKISDLPKCPECGLAPEFNWKIFSAGTCFGALKCPLNHYRVTIPFGAGSKLMAQKELMKAWGELIAAIPKETSVTFKVE